MDEVAAPPPDLEPELPPESPWPRMSTVFTVILAVLTGLAAIGVLAIRFYPNALLMVYSCPEQALLQAYDVGITSEAAWAGTAGSGSGNPAKGVGGDNESLLDAIAAIEELERALSEDPIFHGEYRASHGRSGLSPETVLTQAILLLEAGRQKEALAVVREVPPDSRASQSAQALQWLLGDANPISWDPRIDREINALPMAWGRDRFAMRLAMWRGQFALAEDLSRRIQERGEAINRRQSLSALLVLVLVVGAAAVAVVWFAKGRPSEVLSSGVAPAPWPGRRCVATILRCHWVGAVATIPFGMLACIASPIAAVGGVVTLLVYLKIANHHLFRPVGLDWSGAMGLRINSRVRLVWVTLMVVGAGLLGQFLIGVVAGLVGFESHWTEIGEEVLLGRSGDLFAIGFQVIVWAPILEEFLFRGLLYPALRRRYSVMWSMIATTLVFAMIHHYSLFGLLAVAWIGFVWCIAYERTRSLWPCVLGHMLQNSIAFLGAVWIYHS